MSALASNAKFSPEQPPAGVIELHGGKEYEAFQEIVTEIETDPNIAFRIAQELEDELRPKLDEEAVEQWATAAANLDTNDNVIELDDKRSVKILGKAVEIGLRLQDGDLHSNAEKLIENDTVHVAALGPVRQTQARKAYAESRSPKTPYSVWAKENRTEEAENRRKASEWRIGHITAQQRAEMTLLARGEELPNTQLEAEPKVEMQRIGGRALAAASVALKRAEPKLIKVAERFRKRGEDHGAVVPFTSPGEVAVAIDAIKEAHGPKHALVKESRLLPHDPRNLHVQLEKLKEDPEYVFEAEAKDAKVILDALAPLAEEARATEEEGLTPSADEYIAARVVTRSEEYSAKDKRQKLSSKRGRLHAQHS